MSTSLLLLSFVAKKVPFGACAHYEPVFYGVCFFLHTQGRYQFNIARCRPCWGFNKNELANKDWGMVTGRVKGDGTGDAEGEGGQVIFVPPGDGRGGGDHSRGTAMAKV